jgi:hypothetical protein
VINPVVAAFAYVLLSVGIVAFHLVVWLATFPETSPEAFWARIGWPGVTTLLGTAWTIAFAFVSWPLLRSPRVRPIAALTVLAATFLTREILAVLVNLPYKGISASEFLDAFLIPGGITPGGNGTLQSILMVAAAGEVAVAHLAFAIRPRRGVPS